MTTGSLPDFRSSWAERFQCDFAGSKGSKAFFPASQYCVSGASELFPTGHMSETYRRQYGFTVWAINITDLYSARSWLHRT